jgi:hypothetical protein
VSRLSQPGLSSGLLPGGGARPKAAEPRARANGPGERDGRRDRTMPHAAPLPGSGLVPSSSQPPGGMRSNPSSPIGERRPRGGALLIRPRSPRTATDRTPTSSSWSSRPTRRPWPTPTFRKPPHSPNNWPDCAMERCHSGMMTYNAPRRCDCRALPARSPTSGGCAAVPSPFADIAFCRGCNQRPAPGDDCFGGTWRRCLPRAGQGPGPDESLSVASPEVALSPRHRRRPRAPTNRECWAAPSEEPVPMQPLRPSRTGPQYLREEQSRAWSLLRVPT